MLLYFTTTIIFASATNCEFLRFNETAMDRIIQGRIVNISDYPYHVGLVKNRKRIICGGALISKKIIFTAAHCTHIEDEKKRKDLSILVGANSILDPNGELHHIETIYKHPDFTFNSFDNDFSVIVLRKPVNFNRNVQTISVSSNDQHGGKVATVSGWGGTEFGTPSKYLKAAELTVEKWHKCQGYFPGPFHPKITRNMICVKPTSETTYYGDSGGPLVIDGELVGLVSFGRTVKGEKKTTVFTRVRNFLDFVENVVPDYKNI